MGLLGRMEALSWAYQQERRELESEDLVSLTIRALCHIAGAAIRAGTHESYTFTVTTEQVRKIIAEVINEEEVSGEQLAVRKVGRVLAKMRLMQAPRPGGHGSRRWRVTLANLRRWAAAYSLPVPDDLLVDDYGPTPG